MKSLVPNKEAFAEFSSRGEIAKSMGLIQRDLVGPREKCRNTLVKIEMGPLDPMGELRGSLLLTFEGQVTGPQLWALWLRGGFSRIVE